MENEKLKQYDEEEKRLDQQIEEVKQKQEALKQKKKGTKLYLLSTIALIIFAGALLLGTIGIVLLGPASGLFEEGLRKVIGTIIDIACGSSIAALAFMIPDTIISNYRYKKEQALKRELEKLRDKSNQLAWKRNNQLTRINQAKKETTPQKDDMNLIGKQTTPQKAYIPEEPTIIEMTQPKVKSKSYKRN